jgi:hypothetical protein
MGAFDDDDDEAPPVQMTPFAPTKAADQFRPINFLQIMDDITGEEFSFVKGIGGKRYLEIQDKIRKKEEEINRINARPSFFRVVENEINQFELDKLKSELKESENELDENGLKLGQVRMQSRNTRNRIPFDEPIKLDNEDLRYVAAVADVTSRLRNLSDTIQTIESVDPALISQNQPVINAFKEANKRALDRGFDFKQNGLDTKLSKMGLTNSSTALGAQIALARERVDAEVNNNLKETMLAQKLKQDTISNMYKMGDTFIQEAGLGLKSREQELAKRKQNLEAETVRRQIGANLAINRNPMLSAIPYLTEGNKISLGAVQQDNNTMLGIQQNELAKSDLELKKFAYEQASQSDPFGEILTTGLTSFVGGGAGVLGKGLANNFLKK